MNRPVFNTGYLLLITSVSALGGLLFGYDFVVIGGAKPFYEAFFGITDNAHLQGWVMSSALIGCLAGASLSGVLSDRFGRKRLLILAAVLFTVSAVGTGAVHRLDGFILYRLLGVSALGLRPIFRRCILPKSPRHLFADVLSRSTS